MVLAATGSSNTFTPPASATNASGVATGTLSSTVAGTRTISATINGTTITQTVAVTVAPSAFSATESSVSANPNTISAGSGTSTITVTTRDACGNAIPGATVVLAATGVFTGHTLTQPTSTTSASGVATGTLRSTVAGTKTVSATIDGIAVTQAATVTTLVVRPSSDGLTPSSEITLPLTEISGLSMQNNTGIQLEIWPATVVTWSTSDLNRASLNTTGLLVAVQGNDNPNTANVALITATSSSTVTSIQVSSFGFDHFPRLTTLVWRPVAGAATYEVLVEHGNGCTSGTASCTVWGSSARTTTSNLRFVFSFVGAQPGRWRVVARSASGALISTSEFVYFRYVI